MTGTRVSLWLAMLLLVLSVRIDAQELRDPTLPPPEMGAASGGRTSAGAMGGEGMAVIVRDGKPFLAVGTRLYAPGQSVGAARIERITETELWLREGKDLRKLPRFAGIQRSVAATSPACGPGMLKTSKATKPTKKSPPAMSAKASTSSRNASPPCHAVAPNREVTLP